MKITNLEILNFRGIKKAAIEFPKEKRVVCLIGAGDSTKSTILHAIEWILWASWNLSVCDSDFYECDTSTPIILRGTFTDLPEKLLSEDKFGLYLRQPNIPIDNATNDEPCDELPICLTVQLTVDSSLEPKWEVVSNRSEPKTIALSDRKTLIVNNIGTNCTKDMVWGKFSVLQKYADAKGTLHDVQTAVLRDVSQKADLHELDDISNIVENVGKEYGVGFNGKISNHMQIQGISLSTTVGLFDGKTPLSQRGLGSQRLLSMGLNINAADNNSILLVDEVESGLEPYRLRSLINEFRVKHTSTGQVIMTTHSPIAVAECTISEILVIQSVDGLTQAFSLQSNNDDADKVMQAQIRKNAEAFLSKKIVVCEGKTEQGFIRALDNYLSKEKGYRIAFNGVGTADGGGSSIFNCAQQLRTCGYDICIFMDSDKPEEKTEKDAFIGDGVSVFDWEEPNAIEEQIFQDVSTEVASELVNVAVEEYGIDSVKNRLSSIGFTESEGQIKLDQIDSATQRAIGTIAKSKKIEWYKRIDLGEKMGDVIFSSWDTVDKNSKLYKVVDDIIEWVIKDDRT